MKRKLNIVFTLMGVSLLGIILFQVYWTVNAYHVNKEKFDSRINTAFQNALDDCKKDYFDSVRRVLVKRLSPAETAIRIDTFIMPLDVFISKLRKILLADKNVQIINIRGIGYKLVW